MTKPAKRILKAAQLQCSSCSVTAFWPARCSRLLGKVGHQGDQGLATRAGEDPTATEIRVQ